jgi:hypothetical protein
LVYRGFMFIKVGCGCNVHERLSNIRVPVKFETKRETKYTETKRNEIDAKRNKSKRNWLKQNGIIQNEIKPILTK